MPGVNVRQFPITPLPDGDARGSLPEGIRQHRRENRSEKRSGENAVLFYSIGHRKRVRGVSIIKHSGHHPVMKLLDDLHEPVRATKLGRDLPQSLCAQGIACFSEVNECLVEVLMLLHPLLL